MKEVFVNPEMEVVLFDSQDVITTSGYDMEYDEDELPFVPAL